MVKVNKQRIAMKFFFMLLLIAVICSLFVYAIHSFLLPPLLEIACQNAKSLCTRAVSGAVIQTLNDGLYDYSDICTLIYDDDGRVCAIKTDSVKLNKLKAAIDINIHRAFLELEDDNISLPLELAFGQLAFFNSGAELKFHIRRAGAVSSDFYNEFVSGGINQTCHRIMLGIDASIAVILPFRSSVVGVDTSVCASQTVIVGSIPEAFTNVENTGDYDGDTVADEIIDFGSQASK